MSLTSEYMVGPIIGQGSFSHVVYAVHKHSQRQVAVKVVEQISLRRHPWLLQAVMTEKKILQSCMTSNKKKADEKQAASSWVVELWAAFYDSHQMYLVLELCTGGDLEGLLRQVFEQKDGSGSPKVVAWYEHCVPLYASQLVQAVTFLHTQNILHCDLKPGNCLLNAETGHLKLADFASAIDMNDRSQSAGNAAVPIIPRGTTEYSCIEIIRAKSPSSLSTAVDFWSAGCIVYAMMHDGKSPFSRKSEALTVQAVVDYCTGKSMLPPLAAASCSNNMHSKSTIVEWMKMPTQLLRPTPEDRARIWNEKILKGKCHEGWDAMDLSKVVLPEPSWKNKVDLATMKDGNAGWSAFQQFE